MNPNIGYIIEKMRGDSLTPLGTGSIYVVPTLIKDLVDNIGSTYGTNEMLDRIRGFILSGKSFLKGKWVSNGEDRYECPVPGGDTLRFILAVRMNTITSGYSCIISLLLVNGFVVLREKVVYQKARFPAKRGKKSCLDALEEEAKEFLLSGFGINDWKYKR